MKKIILLLCCFSALALICAAGFFYFYNSSSTDNSSEIPAEVSEEISQDPKDEIHTLSFIAAGDALIHDTVYKDAYNKADGTYDFRHQIELIKPIVSKYDLAFYNQETIFAGKEIGYSNYPTFNTPSEFGDAMLDAGFNIVALANNHSFDKGEKGVLNALSYWKSRDALYSGMNDSFEAQNEIEIRTKNNISYALLSYTTLNNGLPTPKGKEYLVNYYSEERAKKDVESIRDKVDVVIVSMHWGVEYSQKVSEEQTKAAEFLADLGVDIICGHHPHVLQPITKIKDTVVIYSMGNFISAQDGVEKLTGAMVSLNITKTNGIISTDAPEVQLIYTYSERSAKYKLIPYADLGENHLKNHRQEFEKQKNIITALDSGIVVR